VIPLLILRPEPGASATAARAAELGLTAIVRPMFRIAPRTWDTPDPAQFDALVLTSANAVRHAEPALARYAHLPIFVVGSATAKAAREAGLADITVDTHNASHLFRTIEKQGRTRPLHLAGEDRTPYPDLPFEITTRIVYASEVIDIELPEAPYVALLHSARAAIHFVKLCRTPAEVDVVAMSNEVAQVLGFSWRSVATAAQAQDDAMLALAARLCKEGSMPKSGPA
jgi:uroporphyrinogen-III synthase